MEKDKKSIPKKSDPTSNSISKKIQNNISTVQIRRNKFGNYEHPETMFIFDKVGQHVIGKQNISGRIDTLTKGDIEECKKYKFKHTVPDNLDKKADLNIEEEDEDEDEVEEETVPETKEEDIIIDEEEEEEEDEEEFDDGCDDEEECYESD